MSEDLSNIVTNLYGNWEYTSKNGGPWYSPLGGGYFWLRDGKTYWKDGDITDSPPCTQVPAFGEVEDYREWSDEKRAAVKAEWAEKRRVYEEERQANLKIHNALVESARAKLTEEEFEAVLCEGRD